MGTLMGLAAVSTRDQNFGFLLAVACNRGVSLMGLCESVEASRRPPTAGLLAADDAALSETLGLLDSLPLGLPCPDTMCIAHAVGVCSLIRRPIVPKMKIVSLIRNKSRVTNPKG